MIKINKIIPQTVELFNPKGESMGFINEYEFNDIRIQIKNQQLEGYYCIFKEKKFTINKHGRSNDWFEGFFDLLENQLMQVL